MTQTLPLQLTDPGAAGTAVRRFVHLEQIRQSETDKTASMADIISMVARARSGVSAKTYLRGDCAASLEDGALKVWFDFYVWPSSRALPFDLTASIGAITPAIVAEEYTEFSVIFGLTDVVELDFMLSEIGFFHWETECYSAMGEPIADVTVSLDGETTIRASASIFGVLRVRGRKIGQKRRVDLSLEKENLSLSKLNVSVTAKWGEEPGQNYTIRLEVAQCVKDMMAWCGGDIDSIANILFGTGGIQDACEKGAKLGYFSQCTGKLIDVVDGESDGWCGS